MVVETSRRRVQVTRNCATSDTSLRLLANMLQVTRAPASLQTPQQRQLRVKGSSKCTRRWKRACEDNLNSEQHGALLKGRLLKPASRQIWATMHSRGRRAVRLVGGRPRKGSASSATSPPRTGPCDAWKLWLCCSACCCSVALVLGETAQTCVDCALCGSMRVGGSRDWALESCSALGSTRFAKPRALAGRLLLIVCCCWLLDVGC